VDGDAKLSDFIRRLRSMKDLAAQAAREAAPLVEAAVRRQAADGQAPDGGAWAPTKDGRRAIPNAARAITAVAKGSAVQIVLAGVYVFHHYGKGLPERRIIPGQGAIPAPVVAALREGARRVFRRVAGGS